ncbi:MAG: response regulator [Gammaproteobacteria bacterium]|nr:response regulator [Gammaproteobacteria bacterium]
MHEQIRQRGEFLVRQLAPASEYGVISGNTDILNNLLRNTLKESGVVFVEIRNPEGKALAKLDQPELQGEMDLQLFEAEILLEGISPDALALPGGAEPTQARPIGRVVLGMSNQPDRDKQWILVGYGLVVALFSLGLAVGWATVIARGLSRPIIDLSVAVKKLKSGLLGTRVTTTSGGEIGSLESDINALAQSLESAQVIERQYTENLIRTREAADQANRAKSQFLANMSHELRTPMNGTLGMLQLLQETEMTAMQDDYVTTAVDATEHLLTVINDILDFSKIDEGKLQLEQIYFDVSEIINRVCNSFQKEAGTRGLALRTEFINSPGPHEVLGDPTRVRQILINLIGNALKFTEAGHITVRCEWRLHSDEALELRLSVADTGVGIEPVRLDTIFLPFTQGDSSMARRHGGTGLGLAICKQLANLMAGSLSVTSTLGAGTRFELKVPMPYRRVANRVSISLTPPPQAKLSGMVLLAEDNTVNQLVVKGFLTRMGLGVELANDGKEAMERFRAQHFDLVIMDCQMPVMDGYEATAAIRNMELGNGRHVPIIALTAHAMQGDRERCLNAGMDDYLSKPVKKEDLHSTLQRWLKTQEEETTPLTLGSIPSAAKSFGAG